MNLQEKILREQISVAVIGIGYVGMTVLVKLAAASGVWSVIGVDIKQELVDAVNVGRYQMYGEEPRLQELLGFLHSRGRVRATTDYSECSDVDVAVICVETPVNREKEPSFEALNNAVASLREYMPEGSLIIVESTIAPGTLRQIGKMLDGKYRLAHCPERVMPGKMLENIENCPRVIGALDLSDGHLARLFYRSFLPEELRIEVTTAETAELVKTAENAYRDVQIAFANEIAMSCFELGVDVHEARMLINMSPGRNMLYPGPGVGGHCLPKDSWLLAHGARNTPNRLIKAARDTNDMMPYYVMRLAQDAMELRAIEVKGSIVTLLGMAYKPNTGDMRNSPSDVIKRLLETDGAAVVEHDPFIPGMTGDPLGCLEKSDCMLVAVKHSAYDNIDLKQAYEVMETPIIVDAAGAFKWRRRHIEDIGFTYIGIGG